MIEKENIERCEYFAKVLKEFKNKDCYIDEFVIFANLYNIYNEKIPEIVQIKGIDLLFEVYLKNADLDIERIIKPVFLNPNEFVKALEDNITFRMYANLVRHNLTLLEI